MTALDLRQEREDRAGCRQLRRARSTGTLVGVYDGEEAGLDTDGGRWSTVCEDHGTIIAHDTLTLARYHSSAPEGWCEECMKPAELRDSDAYADDPEGATRLWDRGFRPIPAKDLREGMLVAFVTELLGARLGDMDVSRVTKVEALGPYNFKTGETDLYDPKDDPDGLGPWGYRFHHTGGNPAEEDEETVVWAKEQDR